MAERSDRYTAASGSGLGDCALLAVHPGGSRVVVARLGPGGGLDAGVRLEVPVRLSGLWRAGSGAIVAADPRGTVWSAADPWGADAGRWRSQELGFALDGVHGAGEQLVVWGRRSSDDAPVLASFDGATWKPVPGPGFPVASARVGGDGIWAVGHGGVGRWDGEGWATLDFAGPLAALDVGDEVVIAAVDGAVFAGGVGGFRLLGRGPASPVAVARWRGGVWVGGGAGLWLLGRGAVRADREVTTLEARGSLLVCTPALVMATADGERFQGGLRLG